MNTLQNKERLLIFIHALHTGGAEKSLATLSLYLTQNIDVTYVTHSVTSHDYVHSGTIHVLPVNKRKNKVFQYTKIIFEMISIIRKKTPTWIISSLQFTDILVLVSILLMKVTLQKTPKVIIRIESAREVKKPRTLRQFLLFPLFRFADHFVVVSKPLEGLLRSNYLISESKISTIHNGVELPNKPYSDYRQRTYDFDIVTIGRLVPAKDYPTFITVIHELVNTYKLHNLRVGIAGGGIEIKRIRQQIKELHLEKNITLFGQVTYTQGQALLLKSKVFLLTSRWEGFGIVLIEAMAKGLPVVSTNCDYGPSEIIGLNNDYGILCPVGDHKEIAKQLHLLLTDTKKRNLLSSKSTSRATSFSMREIVKKHEQLLYSLVSPSSS